MLFDVNILLVPIQKKAPTGQDLRLQKPINPLYTKIKDARFAARTAERQQLQAGDASDTTPPQWSTVLTVGQEILTKHSKDLDVAVWVTEALLRERGFAGLKDGFWLIRELIARYWDTLYPTLDEDGLSAKLASLTGLNGEETDGTLIVPIAMVPLTQGHSAGPFALWQCQTVSPDAIQLAVKETAPLFFHQLREDLLACKHEFIQLTNLLDERCGADSPPTSRIRTQLDACLECINMIAKDIVGAKNLSSTDTEISTVGATHASPTATETVLVGAKNLSSIDSRENVLQALLQAAEFFRRTEPHSPLSYVLERTVRWGRMPLPELLKELVRDEPSLGHIRSLTGVE